MEGSADDGEPDVVEAAAAYRLRGDEEKRRDGGDDDDDVEGEGVTTAAAASARALPALLVSAKGQEELPTSATALRHTRAIERDMMSSSEIAIEDEYQQTGSSTMTRTPLLTSLLPAPA